MAGRDMGPTILEGLQAKGSACMHENRAHLPEWLDPWDDAAILSAHHYMLRLAQRSQVPCAARTGVTKRHDYPASMTSTALLAKIRGGQTSTMKVLASTSMS